MSKKTHNRPPRIVVIGGSEGAIEALLEIVPQLPSRFPAAIFIVIHLPVEANSYLPKILSRSGLLPALHPQDGDVIRSGRLYVAPPDYHLTLEARTIRVRRGPRENRHRPAIDPLFRTAANVFGPAVIAVLLSGNLDDGSAGMFAVRHSGGLGIVQSPAQALVREMPQRALDYAGADFVIPAREIASKLIELVSRDGAMKKSKKSGKAKRGRTAEKEVREHEHDILSHQGKGQPSVFACPECHGILWEVEEGRLVRYRCRVGHAYSADSLQGELGESAERALWAAMRALEEKAAIGRRLAVSAKGSKGYAQRLKEQSEADDKNAEIIRNMIFSSK